MLSVAEPPGEPDGDRDESAAIHESERVPEPEPESEPEPTARDVPAPMPARTKKTAKAGSKNAKQPAKSKPASEPPGDGERPSAGVRVRRMMLHPRMLLLLALIPLAAVVLPELAKSIPDPAERPEYRLKTTEITVGPLPRDVPPDLVRQAIQRAELPDEVSVLDDDLTQRIAEAFAAHPWVAEVVSVEKSFPAKVSVELKYRTAVAMVEVSGGMYPIDSNAVLLPPEDFSISDTRRYPALRGVESRPQRPAGRRWRDPVVFAAAKLAEQLQPDWQDLQLAAFRAVEPVGETVKIDDVKFELITRGGSRILWGRAPGTDHPGELSSDQKIARLRKYLADFGGFDQPHGPYEIDIRHWQEITRRPITLRPPTTTRR